MEKLIKTYNPRGLVPVVVERTKPGIGSNDQLDDIANQFAEYERTQHEAGECVEDCPHCAADRHYQQSTFDRLQAMFQKGFKP